MSMIIALIHRWRRLQGAWRVAAARAFGVRLGAGTRIGPGVTFQFTADPLRQGGIETGAQCQIEQGAILDGYGGQIRLGDHVFLGAYSLILGHGDIFIGDQTLIASHCRLLSAEHDVPAAGVPIRSRPDRKAPTRIGKDCWLGTGVTVTAGVTIGDGAVIGAGAVVTRDIPAGAIALGVPARVVGHRAED